MAQKYIVGDVVMYDNKIMIIKEPRDGSHFDLSCPKDGLTYCYVSINEIKGIPLTSEILEKNGWYGATHSKQSDDTTKILYKTFKRKCYPTIKVSQDLKITCELSPFIVKLESVSDLQHLLFGLGLDSNLKI